MQTKQQSANRSAKIRRRLLSRIERRYQITSEEVDLSGVRFTFTRIANPDRVLDEVAAEADLRDRLSEGRADGDQLHLPYWAELWDSGRGIGIYLVGAMHGWPAGVASARRGPAETDALGARSSAPAREDDVRPPDDNASGRHVKKKRRLQVLDLGCGMGMAGAVAAALGAEVIFADLEPPALLFAQLNSLPWRRRILTRQLNWQHDTLDRKFDLIIGADILYERAQWPFLETFWRCHLRDNGCVLLGEPGRQTGDAFLGWIAAHGWRVVTTEIAVTTRPKPIRIFTVQLAVGN